MNIKIENIRNYIKSIDIKSILRKQFMPEKSANSGTGRIYTLDFLKIVAAFLVVFYHCSYYRMNYGFVKGEFYFPNFSRICMCIAAFSVPLFFLVNGMLMFRRKRSWQSVYLRALKIVVLVIAWHWIKFPSWFLKTLVILYILFPLFQYVREHSRKLFLCCCLVVFIMPFTYNLVILPIQMAGIRTIGPFELRATGCFTMYSILYFLLGALLSEKPKYSAKIGSLLFVIGWILVVTECTIYTNINQMMHDSVNNAFPTMGALFMTLGFYMVCSNFTFERIKKPLMFIGKSVLSIYIMHLWFTFFIYHHFWSPSNMPVWTAVLYTIGLCTICVLLGKIIQKTPILCWFLKI